MAGLEQREGGGSHVAILKPQITKFHFHTPKGYPIFSSAEEYKYFMENQSKINYQYKNHMHKLNTKVHQDEKESKQKINVEQLAHEQGQIPLPKPNDKHNYCGICLVYYSEYVKHVRSDRHRVCVDERDASTLYDNH